MTRRIPTSWWEAGRSSAGDVPETDTREGRALRGAVMDNRESIQRMLRSLARRLRLVRACAACIRFLVVGLALALVPLFLKGLFPAGGPAAAMVLTASLTLLGFLYGFLVRLPLPR